MTSEVTVDALLESWDKRLSSIDENLLALEGDPTYQMLSGAGRAELTGVTRERIEPVLASLAELFECRSQLTALVERAKAMRADLGFWDKDQKLQEIQDLFHQPSIKVASRPKPLAQRHLLDPSAEDVGLVPEHLLVAMSRTYEGACEAIAGVARAWSKLEPVLEGAEQEVGALARAAKELGAADVQPELTWLGAELARVRSLVSKDPLGAGAGVDAGLTPRLATLKRRLHELKAVKLRVTTGILAASALAKDCEAAHAAARAAGARLSGELFDEGLPPPVEDTLVAGLVPWLSKIEATARAGRFAPADVGLTRWQETASAYVAQDRKVVAALEARLAHRTELEGRLSARQAQLAALAARGASVDAALVERATKIAALLRARPTRLAAATRAVEAFEAEVVALAARSRRE